MDIISKLDKAQKNQIPFYIEKWKSKCLLTIPVNPTHFEQGIQDIHKELGMEEPREFLYYPSPTAMYPGGSEVSHQIIKLGGFIKIFFISL